MGMLDKTKNAMQSSKGRAKEAAGRATHDPSLGTEGKVDKAAGSLKQAGENVKDAIKE